ncbi:zinc finger MYND domain-containing protein 10 isoform X1 [Rhopalosiphum maidis]|uniref:zinc finger MYND domain-containing protein 10 isoform X1 n=1 Tax=Rhopalosiphum maidis TaxID=43146 RepID=UPI000EFEF314|nr:zinc finger MYND domain-containing protein 10 isoform X1 [Rhopalosiphum maidis]
MMDIISQNEVDFFIEHIKESKLNELGSKIWYDSHDRLQKLNQQATLDASKGREEYIKDQLISYGKVSIIVHEAICVAIWREKVLPELLCIIPNPTQSFTLYFILFHETVAVGLLQKILFHEEGVQSLGNYALDLFDHIIFAITHIAIGNTNNFQICSKITNMPVVDEIIEHKHKIQFEVGICCIGIMFNMLLHVKNLSLSVTTRMTTNNDVPMLLCQLLNVKPWIKWENKKKYIFQENSWKIMDETNNIIPKQEAHLWLSLHEFFTSEQLRKSYEITQFRKKNLMQLQHLLNDSVLDQIPPLIHFRQCLYQLSLTEVSTRFKRTLIMELNAEIRPTILNTYTKQWKKIARTQVVYLFGNDSYDVAKSLSETYEHIDDFEVKENICAHCRQPAKNRCSKCKKQWYCSRKCQVTNWDKHKIICQ